VGRAERHLRVDGIDYQWMQSNLHHTDGCVISPPQVGMADELMCFFYPPLSAALTFSHYVTAAGEGRADWLTLHFLPAVSALVAAKVREVRLACGHLMKRRDRWSEE